MAHCIVSLKSSGRFEQENGIEWDLVCVDNKTLSENGSSIAKTQKRKFRSSKITIIKNHQRIYILLSFFSRLLVSM